MNHCKVELPSKGPLELTDIEFVAKRLLEVFLFESHVVLGTPIYVAQVDRRLWWDTKGAEYRPETLFI